MKLLYCGFFLLLNVFVSTTGHSLKTSNKCDNIQSGDCSNVTTHSFFDIYNREGTGNSFSGRVNVSNSEPTTRHAKRTHRVPKRKGRRRGGPQHRYSTRVLSLKPSEILLPPFELQPKSNGTTIDPFIINLHSDNTKTSQKNTYSDTKVEKNTSLHTKVEKNNYSDLKVRKNTYSNPDVEKNTHSDSLERQVDTVPMEEVISFNNLDELNLLLTPPLPDDTKTVQKSTYTDTEVEKNTSLVEKNTNSDSKVGKNINSDTHVETNTHSDTKVEPPMEEGIPFNNLLELNLLLTPPLPDDTKTVQKNTYTDTQVEKNTSLVEKNTYSDTKIRKNTYSDTEVEKKTHSDTKVELPLEEGIPFNNLVELHLILTPPLPDDTKTAQKNIYTDTPVEKNTSLQTKLVKNTNSDTKIRKNTYSDTDVEKNTHSDTKVEPPMEEVIPFNNIMELNLLLAPPLPDESDFTEFISYNDKINEEINLFGTYESVKVVNPKPHMQQKHNISFSNIIHVLDNNFTQNVQNYNDFTTTIRPNEEFIYNLTSKDNENRPFNDVEAFNDNREKVKNWDVFNGTLLAPEVAELGIKVVTSAKGAELMRQLTQEVEVGRDRSPEDRAPGSLQTAETGHYFRNPHSQRLTQSNELSAQEAYKKMRKQLNPYKTCRGGKGLIPDLPSGCQFFYVCLGGGGGEAMMCPQGTLFNQDFLVCDWDYNVECGSQSL